MIRSMTGYGKSEISLPDKKITIEIRSLNSKNNDISLKIPYALRIHEPEIRQLITETLQRGKIDLTVTLELTSESSQSMINKELVKSYYLQLLELNNELNAKSEAELLSLAMRLPDAIKTEKNEADESEWLVIRNCLVIAIGKLDEFRIQEGKALEKDLSSGVEAILSGIPEIAPFEQARIEKLREKLRLQLQELVPAESIDKNRFEQEMIYYIEKMDISEEKTRLANHCRYFTETMEQDDNAGKKLGFILQEIGREINTLGSKAGDSDIQRVVVKMKDQLERLKEQSLNIL